MRKNRRFMYFLTGFIIFMVLLTFGNISGIPTQAARDFETPKDKEMQSFEDGFNKLFPPQSTKKDFEMPLRNNSSQDQTNELRYLIIGTMDQEMAFTIKLLDKSKANLINATAFVQYLRQKQAKNNRNRSLQRQIDNLIYELCILDMGKTTRRELLNYINRIDGKDSDFNFMPDSDAGMFKSIVELIKYNILSPMEGIDSLILLKYNLKKN